MIVPEHLRIAFQEIGVHEVRNRDRIYEYLKIAGLPYNLTTPWCTVFIGWCLKQAGMRYIKTAHARDYIDYGMDVDDYWPKLGDVLTFARGPIEGTMGHNTFYIGRSADLVYTYGLGGNQSDMVCIKPFLTETLLAVRRPIIERKVVAK